MNAQEITKGPEGSTRKVLYIGDKPWVIDGLPVKGGVVDCGAKVWVYVEGFWNDTGYINSDWQLDDEDGKYDSEQDKVILRHLIRGGELMQLVDAAGYSELEPLTKDVHDYMKEVDMMVDDADTGFIYKAVLLK